MLFNFRLSRNAIGMIVTLLLCLPLAVSAGPGDTVVVKTIRYDTNMRSGTFSFPDEDPAHWEKILMLYSMRCKNGLVSTQTSPNQGCGEWDYNCYTYVVDSGQSDSLMTKSPSHVISDFSGPVFRFTLLPQSLYSMSYQQMVNYTSISNETVSTIGSGTLVSSWPMPATEPGGRTQYLFSAAELSAAGLQSGDIHGLRLNIITPGGVLNNLRINIKQTTQTQLQANFAETEGFTNVFYLNTAPASSGELAFAFHTPFVWDGISNLLVEFTYTNAQSGPDNTVSATDAGYSAALHAAGPDSYLRFNGGVQSLKVNPAIYPLISDQITLAFWSFGDSLKLPANTTVLEGVDAQDRRQVNVHLPWSNSRVYWDCGNDGSGYDRIDQAANPADFKGKWNHWVFTKNATSGEMKIWLNGHTFASGTNKTKLIDLQKFIFGASPTGSLYYYGGLDDISIWNTALDSLGIDAIMRQDISPQHPDYSHLLAWYTLNEAQGVVATDFSSNGFNSQLVNPTWWTRRGQELNRNFIAGTIRPNTGFVQGTYTLTVQAVPVIDSLPEPASSIISYIVQNNAISVVDTSYAWQAGWSYIYGPQQLIWDSVYISPEDSIIPLTLTWYLRRAMKLELINFITPYGKGLNLNGLTGKTWTIDVTDYAPVLRGKVFLGMGDGIYQEDNDITFVFYEGTPPRTVRSIQQIWPDGTWVQPSYNDIYNNRYFEPRQVRLDPDASMFKLRSAISGHGQEGEFIPRTHTLSVNDSLQFPRQVWKACASNPIYPQGGTWIYDRAGWCPGSAVDLAEFEISGLVNPGDLTLIDYSLPYSMNPGSSNYRVNNQLVSYSAPNFETDASLDAIRQPSTRTEFSRLNPLCNDPLVIIRNTGAQPLTGVTITYGRAGGTMSSFNWSGTLGFLDTAEVRLPAPDWMSSSQNSFIAWVSMPNGLTDPYHYNDTLRSTFNPPPVYPHALVFELKTNYRAGENRYTIVNSAGDTVHQRDFLSNNSIYRDTLNLPSDCYTLYLTDDGEDGLNFWNNPNAGSGYFRIKGDTGNVIYKSFNADFGSNIYHQFSVYLFLPVPEITQAPEMEVFPNPASSEIRVRCSLQPGSKAGIRLFNCTGQTIISQDIVTTDGREEVVMDVQDLPAGLYFLEFRTTGDRINRKIVITR